MGACAGHAPLDPPMLLTDKLSIDAAELDEMPIDRVHRIGVYKDNKPRPIIAKFMLSEDKDLIFKKKGLLKGSNIYIMPQYHPETQAKRAELKKEMSAEILADKKKTLSFDKLWIDGKQYTPMQRDKCHKPPNYDPGRVNWDENMPELVHTDKIRMYE